MIAGVLELQMLTNLAKVSSEIQQFKGIVGSSMSSVEKSVASAKSALASLGGVLSVAMFVNLVKGSVDALDKLNDLSKSTGLTVEQLGGLRVAAKQSGGDLDSIATSINKLSVEMGKSPAKFRALGISAKDPLEAFKQLSDIFISIDNPQQRAALGAAALGKAWAGAAPLLAEGSANISEMVDTGTRLSGVTTEMARQADMLNDKWTLLGGTGGFLTRMVAPLLPLLNEMADELLNVSDNSLEMASSFNPLPETLRTLIILGSDFAFVWRQIGISIVGVKEQIAGFAVGGIKGFLDARKMMIDILEAERRALDAYQKKIMEAGKDRSSLIPAPDVDVDPSASGRVTKFLATGEDEAAKAAREHAKAIRDKMAWLKAGAESQERYNQAILDAIEAGDKETARIRESALAMSDMIAELALMNDQDRAATIEKKRAEQEAGLETLRQSLMTEDELRKFSYENDFNLLNDTLGMKKEAQEEYYTLMGRLIRRNNLEQLLLERQKNDFIRSQQVATWQQGAELLQQFAGESKAAAIAVIAINKALAIAQVMMNIPVAQARALAELGPIAGPAAAATIGAWGAAQIAIIAATGLVQAANVASGGADLGTPANPISTTPGLGAGNGTTANQGGGITTIVNLYGDSFSRKQVKELLEKISENTRDGGRVVLA